jgi:hypothetical protein
MLILKSCPRCGGDLFLEAQLDESELYCLQCAHRVAAGNLPARLRRLADGHKAAALKSLRVPVATGT